MTNRIFPAILAASAAFALSGCVTDGYGYGGVDVGYGSGYGGGYGNGYYGGDPYWGWNDDFYYPGAGYYIYDRGGSRHRWNDSQRAYWEGRRGNRPGRENWSGYGRDRNAANGGAGRSWPQGRPAWRGQNSGQNAGQNPAGATGQQQGLTSEARQQRREAWRAQRQQSQPQGTAGQSVQQPAQSGGGSPMWRGRGGGRRGQH